MRQRRPLPAPVLRRLAERADDYGLSRRAFLGLLGAAGGASALAGCTLGDSPVSPRGQGGMPGYVRWANYEWYIDKDESGQECPTLDEFEAETDIRVMYYEAITDNKEFTARVRNQLDNHQDIGYDVVTISDWTAKEWSDRGHIAALDRAAMPNLQNLRSDLANPHDPDNRYSIPWQIGFPVIAWNRAAVPDGITSVNDLWDPRFRGKVALIAELRETLGPIMWTLGTDPGGDWGTPEFEAALGLLEQQIRDGQIMSVKGGDLVQLLVDGRATVGLAYGGDVGAFPDTLGYAVPAEGSTRWIDVNTAPVTTEQVASVERLMNFYYDPAVAAAVAAYVQYVTPVNGVREEIEKIDPELVDSPLIFPSEETLAKLAVFRELSEEESAEYETRFAQVTQTI